MSGFIDRAAIDVALAKTRARRDAALDGGAGGPLEIARAYASGLDVDAREVAIATGECGWLGPCGICRGAVGFGILVGLQIAADRAAAGES